MSIAESEKVSSDQIQVTENLEERIIQEDATTTTTIIDSKTNESTKTNETIKESKEETEEDPIILSRKEMPSNSATTTTKNSKPLQTLGFSQERTTPNKILDYLYLGDQVDSENNEKLKSLKVTHIINMAFIENPFQDQFKYLKIDVYDSPMQKIFPHFQECFDFIDDARANNGIVLLHCHMGVSRSATIAVAYCMKTLGWTMANAYQFVGRARGIIMPNDGFFATLALYEEFLWKENKAKSEGITVESAVEFKCTMTPDPKWLRIHRPLLFPNEPEEQPSLEINEQQISTSTGSTSSTSTTTKTQQQPTRASNSQNVTTNKEKKRCVIV